MSLFPTLLKKLNGGHTCSGPARINKVIDALPMYNLFRPLNAIKNASPEAIARIDVSVYICLPGTTSQEGTDLESIGNVEKAISSWQIQPLFGFFFPEDNTISLYREHISGRT